ncbi:MerR family transcriptional regulator [Alsobacter metallidurans]|uniref:MerR family transcriptional regulator n=1 Tax=Alsobacter metallidurans TaxID=340221 RepID=A0A917I7G8_9HYPH|nr:MerR family transcriptional regulator [Alsobacter metallidurans]GGH17536.1 MerR family transcriptional regulator [Alsobacter metallidurans]
MDKSPDAFRTISEVADDLDLPQHVLRFWETRFAQIRPLKRGGGRRYYRPDDVDLLRGIRQLLYGQGYTIKGVQRILKEQGLRSVQALGRGEITAPMPPPSQGRAGDDDDFEPDERESDDGDDNPLSPPETGATRGALVSTAGGIVMSPDAIRRLQGALSELVECQRLLQSIKPQHDGDAEAS